MISEGKFIKYPPPYDSAFHYDLPLDGLPGFIDTNNPYETILFFQNTGKVILLDSSLNELIRPFYLEEIGMYDVSMIFATRDKGLWFYNFINNSISKMDKKFSLINRSLSLNTYFQYPNHPNYIAEFEGKIYLNIPSNGILVLGANGEYQTAFHLPGLIDFQIDRKAVYFYRDNIIYCYNYKTLKFKRIYIPYESGILNAWFFEDQILVLKKDGFTVYNHNISPVDNN
jgi:hypothetical protein